MAPVLGPLGQWPGPMGQWPGIAPRGPGIVLDRPRSDGIGPSPPVLTGRTLHMVCTKRPGRKCAFWNARVPWPVGNANILIWADHYMLCPGPPANKGYPPVQTDRSRIKNLGPRGISPAWCLCRFRAHKYVKKQTSFFIKN
jgi:hypothetical protein